MPLTKRQKEILDFLEEFLTEQGYPPSFEEIAQHFGYGSLATVHEHLENLKRKGYIRKSYNASRSIELVPAGHTVAAVELPLLGRVAAGLPIEAIEDRETVSVPEDMISRGGQHYVLRVRGDSMIDEQIRDGDFIIVNSRSLAQNGEVVVALVEGDSATVKKFYREGDGRVRLQPANVSMPPMYFPADDVTVQGVVVGVIRRY
jgi:repressor LexA